MTQEQKQELRGAVADTAKGAATAVVNRAVEKEKDKLRRKMKKRTRKLVRGVVIGGVLFCAGYLIGVHRKEIALYVLKRI